jgi:glycosyltransferase involved in cell wall biosynthesis
MLKTAGRSSSKPGITILQLESYKGWVIDGMLRDALNSIELKARWVYIPETRKSVLKWVSVFLQILTARKNLKVYGNHKTFFAVQKRRVLRFGPCRVFVTQVLDGDKSLEHTNNQTISNVERFLVQNFRVMDLLSTAGVERSKIVVNPGGVDRTLFFPVTDLSEISDYVLISGSFRSRKNPELISRVIKDNPDIRFMIHGSNLDVFSDIGPNVELIPFNFLHQPKFMREARLHLILSQIEGGPMSVLEALASGTPCVTTDVGFCREIVSSEKGIVLGSNPKLSEISIAIKKTWDLKKRTYNQDLLGQDCKWETFATQLFL